MDKDLKKKILSPSEYNLNEPASIDSPTIRIIVIGKKKSGKTCLIRSFLKKNYSTAKQDTELNIYCKKMALQAEINDKDNKKKGKDEIALIKKTVKTELNIVVIEIGESFIVGTSSLFREIVHKANAIIFCYELEEIRKKKFQLLKDETFIAFNEQYENEGFNIPLYFALNKLDNLETQLIDSIKINNNHILTKPGNDIDSFLKEANNNEDQNNEDNEDIQDNYFFDFRDVFITSALLNINVEQLFKSAIQYVLKKVVDNWDHNQNGSILVPKDEYDSEEVIHLGPDGECNIF